MSGASWIRDPALTLAITDDPAAGHPSEAIFENRESEFLAIASMVWLAVSHAPHHETGH